MPSCKQNNIKKALIISKPKILLNIPENTKANSLIPKTTKKYSSYSIMG